MVPQLALLACTLFVVFLLRVELQLCRGVSRAIWIPTIWMLTIVVKPWGAWNGAAQSMYGDNNEAGSLTNQLVLLALLVASLVVLANRRFNCIGTLRSKPWLMILLGYMLLSTAWSAIPLIALRRWIREAIIVAMILDILSEREPLRALESVLRRFAYIVIPYSLLLIKYYPNLGRVYGRWSGIALWVGVANEKNNFGCLNIVSAFFLFGTLLFQWSERSRRARYRRWGAISIISMCVYLLTGADKNSSTCIASLGVAIAILIAMLSLRKFKISLPRPVLIAFFGCLIVFGTSAPFLGGSNVTAFSGDLGRDQTLTGRTEIWARLVPVVYRDPLLGHGFGSFWTASRRRAEDFSDGHNGYLDTLLDFGAIGLVLYAAFFLFCIRKLHGALATNYCWASLAIAFMAMTLVYNTTESTLSSLVHQMTAISVLMPLTVLSTSARNVYRMRSGGADLAHGSDFRVLTTK
jgi:exopolysaccharide production protein ExoQ